MGVEGGGWRDPGLERRSLRWAGRTLLHAERHGFRSQRAWHARQELDVYKQWGAMEDFRAAEGQADKEQWLVVTGLKRAGDRTEVGMSVWC